MANSGRFFNILIRSSGRPNYFASCMHSIRGQDYAHYQVFVAYDDNESAAYLKEYKGINLIRVNTTKAEQPPRHGQPATLVRPFHPNLYFNELLPLVERGFIIFLDDDDCFIRTDSLSIINHAIETEDDLVFWKVMFSKYRIVPDENHFKKPPKYTQINTCGFTFNYKYASSANWDGWSGGDFYVAKKLYDIIPAKKYVSEKLTGMQEQYAIAGHGLRLDKVVNTHDLKKHFDSTGYAPPFRLFSTTQIAEIWQTAARLSKKSQDWEKGLAVESRFFYELSTHPHLLERVIAVLGKNVLLWGCSIIARPPGSAHPWHCDIEAAALSQGQTVNVWIGLKNTQRENGIRLIPFTHRLSSIQEELATHRINRSRVTHSEVLAWARRKDARAHLIHPDLSDGDCLMFDGNTWHSSENNTTLTRYALLIQFATPEAPIRMPDINNFNWPFMQINIPRPPIILVSGDDHTGLNHLVKPPAAHQGLGNYAIRQSRIYPLQLPLPFQVKQKWRPFPIFNGHTADLQHITCHISALAPAHQPHPPHTHKEEEILIIMHGNADIILPKLGKNHRVRLGPGDFVYYPAHYPHTIEGVSESGVNYLMLKWFNDVPSPIETLSFIQHVVDGKYEKNNHKKNEIDFGLLFDGSTTSLSKLHAHITRLAPGANYSPHIDPYDVAIIVLSGQVETLNQKVDAGQVIFYPSGMPHGMANVSNQPATYLVFEFHGSPAGKDVDLDSSLSLLSRTEDNFKKQALELELQKLQRSYSMRIGRKITKFAEDFFSWLPAVRRRM